MGFVLLFSGLFKETFDLLENVNMDQLSKPEKAEYYTLMARYHCNVADYDNDRTYAPRYNDSGNRYIDSSLTLPTRILRKRLCKLSPFNSPKRKA